MYMSGIKQMRSSKGSRMTVDDLEDGIVSLYRLIHLGEESDD